LASDNDFIGTVVDEHHAMGIDNPNQFFVFAFFVFAVDPALPPDFEHQGSLGGDDRDMGDRDERRGGDDED
jgi:hypothetical protein